MGLTESLNNAACLVLFRGNGGPNLNLGFVLV